MENTLIKQIKEEVGALDNEGLWKHWEEIRKQKKQIQLVEKALKGRIEKELGDDDSLVLDEESGAGVWWEHRAYKEVSLSDAERIVQDLDMIAHFTKIDLKKAKDVLDKDTFKELEGAAQQTKTVRALKTGKVKP